MTDTHIQDLFWNGINSDADTNLGFLKSIVDQSLLGNLETPYFIYTGNGRIYGLENMEFSYDIIARLNSTGLYIFLYEPICLRVNGEYNLSFYSECDYDVDNVTSDELDSILAFIKKNNLESVKIYVTDYNTACLQRVYPTLNITTSDIFLLGVSVNLEKKHAIANNFTKPFWCGNWRYTPHRHLVMSKLVTIDGNYSWHYYCDLEILKENSWFRDFTNDIISRCNLLNSAAFSIDSFIEKKKVLSFRDHSTPSIPNQHLTEQLGKSYSDSFCAVVTETRYAQPMANVSEKTLYPMFYKLPLIVVGAPYSLEYIKSLGFKTFDRWWDESYDTIENHQDRLKKIFDVIDYINSKPIEELKTIYEEMYEVLDHNYQQTLNLKKHIIRFRNIF
jgi:hypothetical protein